MEIKKAFELAKRIQSIAHTGLVYSTDAYNTERYKAMEQIGYQLMELLTGHTAETLSTFFLNAKEYPTPKTDIRAVVFNDKNEILLVKEKADNKWSLPGGWADIGFSPKEMVVNEVEEETGFTVFPVRLLAILDKKFYPHPPEMEYVYKYFIECRITGGEITRAHDIHEVAFFSQHALPPLSENRVLPLQIDLMFEFRYNPQKEMVFD